MIDVVRRTRLHAYAVALVASVALAGCGDSPPERAGTVGESSAETGEGAQEDSSETEEVELDTVGRELTNEEAKAALPPVSALPTGWSVDPENTLNDDSESDSESEETIEPAKCQTIMDDLSEEQDQDPTGEASQTYTAGMLGPFLGVEINSFSDDVPEDSFTKFLDALSTCSKFTSTEDGTATTFKVSSLSFPNLGEESAAIRMSGESEGMAVGLDMVAIRAGHNIVTLSQASVGGATGSGKALEKVARATVTNMESD
ncbi:hypothetical protein [Janibacter sp. DB-40]|uniref:hypothetical protein n=1 Tax=Janibacter sp. DB-40 TaxID=3028808 RepID=UPI002406A333|nr:hypothetical protein [Janibacter sp. DB-40]